MAYLFATQCRNVVCGVKYNNTSFIRPLMIDADTIFVFHLTADKLDITLTFLIRILCFTGVL